MAYKFAHLSNIFLLASVVFASPASRLEARLAPRRDVHWHSQPINLDTPTGGVSNVGYTFNWAGAVSEKTDGTFTTVTGIFTVPAPSGSDGGASVWVGIDGYACKNAILQTGINIGISGGVALYSAWYEWLPDVAHNFYDISINAGDVINATVTAHSATSGVAVIENLTAGQRVTRDLTVANDYALCGQSAEWIVEDFAVNDRLIPFVDFGTLTFSSASASGPYDTYMPLGATIIDIEQNDKVLTSVSTSGSDLTIKYV